LTYCKEEGRFLASKNSRRPDSVSILFCTMLQRFNMRSLKSCSIIINQTSATLPLFDPLYGHILPLKLVGCQP